MNEVATLFALDCGATNWRLYRASYTKEGERTVLQGEPQVAPLTSFFERRLPAAILLSPQGDALEGMGDVAQQELQNTELRERVRVSFKPCIGSHLDPNALPHQKRYTHTEALAYTRMMLCAVVEQIEREKWRSGGFDDRVWFSFAYPVHWKYAHAGQIFDDFQELVMGCLPEVVPEQVLFFPEPEGAIRSLQRYRQLSHNGAGQTVLVADIGGSTTDLVVGEMHAASGEMRYLGHYGEPFGGDLYDAEIAKYVADILNVPASQLTEDPAAMVTLRVFARQLKESLSRQLLQSGGNGPVPQRTVTLVLTNGEVFRRVIKVDENLFGEITQGLSEQFDRLLERALIRLDIQQSQIDQVILVGGGAQLFSHVRQLGDFFDHAQIVLADNPEEIVAQGLCLAFDEEQSPSAPVVPFTAPGMEEEVVPPDEAVAWQLEIEDQRLPLEAGSVSQVGRDRANTIQLIGEKVSRFHARLTVAGAELQLFDLGSTNGTFVNEERIPEGEIKIISSGDLIRFGDREVRCHFQTTDADPAKEDEA